MEDKLKVIATKEQIDKLLELGVTQDYIWDNIRIVSDEEYKKIMEAANVSV